MYAKGLGVAQNMPEAVRLLEEVAHPNESSDAFAARIELGRIYSTGPDLTADGRKALYWYRAALAISKNVDDFEGVREAEDYVARSIEA
jgi:TPR repeat protein